MPWKSGIRTSMRHSGDNSRISRIVSAKTRAPPRWSSWRLTLVTTACFKPSVAAASATRRGSSQSIASGLPLGTAQKPHRRVQMSPKSMNVAVRWFQHSPMLGHCADSHTVCNPRPRDSFLRLWKFSPTGALARSHSGFGGHTVDPTSIWTNWELPPIPHSILHDSLAIREHASEKAFDHTDTEYVTA